MHTAEKSTLQLFQEDKDKSKLLSTLRGIADSPLPILIDGRASTGKSTVGLLLQQLSGGGTPPRYLFDELRDYHSRLTALGLAENKDLPTNSIIVSYRYTAEELSLIGQHIRITCVRTHDGERTFQVTFIL